MPTQYPFSLTSSNAQDGGGGASSVLPLVPDLFVSHVARLFNLHLPYFLVRSDRVRNGQLRVGQVILVSVSSALLTKLPKKKCSALVVIAIHGSLELLGVTQEERH